MTQPPGHRNELQDLQFHWGDAYLITAAGEHWIAQRRDDGRMLAASGPDALRDLIIEDYAERPVSREVSP
jgi:hypothetical protein